jgi:class 3 adenylate cyclase/CHASE2 domain-containing sensor protein
VKLKPLKRLPFLIAFSLIVLLCVVRCLRPHIIEWLELGTFDMRVRQAAKLGPTVATNLGFVYVDEATIAKVWSGSLGYRFGLYWPRQVYGRIASELTQEGAKAVAFDVLFSELRPDHARVIMADAGSMESDDFFAGVMRESSNVVLALSADITPPALFAQSAWALGDITTEKDQDGILRRVKVFRTYRKWHSAFRQLEADPDYGVDLRKATIGPREIVLPRRGEEPIRVPLDTNGCFSLADFAGDNLPSGVPRFAKPFTQQHAWHMGVALAARELGLDLANPEIDLPHGRITLRGPAGLERVIPVDSEGYFYIDWCLSENDPHLQRAPVHQILALNRARGEGKTNLLADAWAGRLVVVGSSTAVGNDLTDRGATPLSEDTLLVSKHWNVANSLLMNRFVHRAPLWLDLAATVAVALFAAVVSARFPAWLAVVVVSLAALAYVAVSFSVYFSHRLWLPVALPVLGSYGVSLCLIAWRVVFEEAERRRVRAVFSKMVSPKIVNELLSAETLSLGGARREITVFFADVRGFTELTDTAQERAAEMVRKRQLQGPAAAACFDQTAKETLDTVNLYLGRVADIIIKNDGTLDKFIGDCVMAFWGAPTPNPRHALSGVRAAMQAQRAVYELNRDRQRENEKLEAENLLRVASGADSTPLLPLLSLGSGLNTGIAAAGLMGSAEAESLSYTVFGREVNLASRLEGASGRGRIFISQNTYQHLLRDDPALAGCCAALEPLKVKGFRLPVQVYEVRWRPADAPPSALDAVTAPDLSSVTGFIQRGTT